MILSILIATIEDRLTSFTELQQELQWQIFSNDYQDQVEVCFIRDNREMTIGGKRNALLDMSRGEYITFLDDDDMPNPTYIEDIMKALEVKPDCLGFKILYTVNGENPRTCIHSLSNKEWSDDSVVFLRNVTHFQPVKRDLAMQVKFPDIRYGEDKVYSDAITKLCKKEIFIDKFLFNYRYSDKVPHAKKYGIE